MSVVVPFCVLFHYCTLLRYAIKHVMCSLYQNVENKVYDPKASSRNSKKIEKRC